MLDKIQTLIDKHDHLSKEMSDPNIIGNINKYTQIAKEHKGLEEVVAKGKEYISLTNQLNEYNEVMSSNDDELKDLIKDDLAQIKLDIEEMQEELKILLIPKDPNDNKNIILEIRSGTGGDEAALFAADLYRMYVMYAEKNNLKMEILSFNENEGTGNGIKEAILSVTGEGAYGNLKFESGVHRVQRVPETESSGRVHTSAATVAVLPEAEDVDVEINDSDLKIDTYRASGAGGQHVNKTESAIRITHIPSGTVVTCQDESSQHKNRDKALKVLRSRLFDMEIERRHKERSDTRKTMVSTGDRSAKIRTYNFPQGRVTDHRINLTLYKLQEVLNGSLDELLDALKLEEQKTQLDEA
ncbi:MAG: peptide chain release factor 1 [Candidatus Marinimicrobia bacterium]|mgnify:FL=1|nr:peptide chain release factor 1 [Candidatus Neomarinimicrobiota bacterium]